MKIGFPLLHLLLLLLYFIRHPLLVASLPIGIVCISSLSVEIGQCRNLTEISLQNNELTSLPESIGELTLLERLGIK